MLPANVTRIGTNDGRVSDLEAKFRHGVAAAVSIEARHRLK
jgi:hypothetical protein